MSIRKPRTLTEVERRLTGELMPHMTDEQAEVVFGAPPGPAFVIAGAGSGKTAVMAARMVAVCAQGHTTGEHVLGLTFTRKAASELADRVSQFMQKARKAGLVEAQGGEPTVGTYHSFAQTVVREFGLRIGLDPDLRIETEFLLGPLSRQVAARTTALASLEVTTRLSDIAKAVRTLDAELAEHVVSTSQLRARETERLEHLLEVVSPVKSVADVLASAQLRRALADVVDEYRIAKLELGVIDFADIMRYSHLIVTRAPAVVAELRARFTSVLLDEYQDTSVVQRDVLVALFGHGHQVLAVGDPKQAIYGFRGAAANTMADFSNYFATATGGPPTRYTLSANFRSGAAIVDVANQTAAAETSQRELADQPLTVGRTEQNAEVYVQLFDTVHSERDFLVADVRHAIETGTPAEKIMVLARSNSDVRATAAALERGGIPATSSDLPGLLDLPEVRDVLAELTVMVDPGANHDLVRLLAGPRWRIGIRDLNLLGARAVELAGDSRGTATDLASALRAATFGVDPVDSVSLLEAMYDPGQADYAPEAMTRFHAFAAEIHALSTHVGGPVADLLSLIIRESGVAVEARLGAAAHTRVAALSALVALAHSFDAASPGAGAVGFIQAVRVAREYDQSPDFDPPVLPDCVRVLTVHKAKGLEADVVYVTGLHKGAFDRSTLRNHWTKYAGALPQDLRGDVQRSRGLIVPVNNLEVEDAREETKNRARQESDRLVYVAFTRPHRRLVLTGHVWAPGLQKPREPSEHLLRVRDRHAVGVTLGDWFEHDGSAANPLLDSPALRPEFPAWDQAATQQRQREAEFVRTAAFPESEGAIDTVSGDQESKATTPADDAPAAAEPDAPDPDLAAGWQRDIRALKAERESWLARETSVLLPPTLSVTGMAHLLADPDDFATNLRRPMPRRPSRAASRGTKFHEWVATQWQQAPLISDLEFAADAYLDEPDVALSELIESFSSSMYANVAPAYVEEPFSVSLAGVTVVGRIDAIFRTADGWEIIDWKTNRNPDADPMQLGLYRLAWSRMRGVDIDQVSAAFFYVVSNTKVPLTVFPTEAELAQALLGRDVPDAEVS